MWSPFISESPTQNGHGVMSSYPGAMQLRCIIQSLPPATTIPRNASSFVPIRQISTHSTAKTKFRTNCSISSSSSDGNPKANDENVVFVAGATGRVGSRTVRELLKLGFTVRAGVRSIPKAESLLVQTVTTEDEAGVITQYTRDQLELVECDLERPSQIGPALGTSSTVICCIGASEKEVFDITGPYRIDYKATTNLIDAATSSNVEHFILLTSLGTNKIGFPAAILNLFWGVLIWKRKAEEALIASGLPYTIVRPGGMERPTDAYKETHNITLSEEDTLFGGQVSNLQVAELMAFMAKNRNLSYCKVVEVVAETSAPLTPFEDLLNKIPSGRKQRILPSEDSAKRVPVSDQINATSPTTSQSPYVCYPDLKPPTSPTPTPSIGLNVDSSASTIPSSIQIEPNISVKAAIPTEPKQTHPGSPYIKYHDLKPPSSPSPSVPI